MPDTAMDWRAHIAAAMRQTEANLDKLNVPIPPPSSSSAPAAFASIPTPLPFADASDSAAARWTSGGGVLMMDKLGRFESAVADLTSTVQRLEMEKTNQAEEVEGLKAELRAVNKRLSERGVDLRTERKMEMWKQRVDGHIDSLGRQVSASSGEREGVKFNAAALITMMDEFRAFKSETRREVDQFSSMLGDLRSQIIEIQGDVASQTSHFRLVSQRADEASDEVRVASTKQRHEKRVVERLADEIERMQSEIRSLRSHINGYTRGSTSRYDRHTHAGGGGGGGSGGDGGMLLGDGGSPVVPPRWGNTQSPGGVGRGMDGSSASTSTPVAGRGGRSPPEVATFETLKRRWAMHRAADADESTLSNFDLTLDASKIIRRGAPQVNLLGANESMRSEPVSPLKD